MTRYIYYQRTSKLWLLAVWTNLGDIAALNFWILYKKISPQNSIIQCSFILQQIKNLRDGHMIQWKPVEHREVGQLLDGPNKRKMIGVERNCKTKQLLFAVIPQDRHANSVVVANET